jgi:hypothetical protein
MLICRFLVTFEKERHAVVEHIGIHPALQSFHVHGIRIQKLYLVGSGSEQSRSPIQWLKSIVQSTIDSHPQLREIVVEVDICQELGEIDWDPWIEFDKILIDSESDLRKVEFVLYPFGNDASWEDCIKKVADVLKGLDEKGLLVIT